MKKSNKIVVTLISVLLVILLVITGVTALRRYQRATAVTADVSWYDENGKEFSITTAEQLYGLAQLSESHDFKGQTIKLDADITVNEGDAKDWAAKAPERLWIPITGFAGCFDGQGHTISGIYGDSIITSLGLFTDTQKTCVIKDLQLVNSCFKNNNTKGTGSIVGFGGGKLENIYSDAVISSAGKYVGGLIGRVTTKGENQITNCWFDGTITMKGANTSEVGGLVGAFTVEDAINAIQHCLSTADITCKGINVGGICGNLGSNSFLNLIDSMYTGTLDYDTNNYDKVGSAIGQITSGSSAIIKDTYTVDEIANRTIGTNGGYQEGSAIAVSAEDLIGVGGYQWTTLDFEKYWAVQKEDTPILSHFAKDSESVQGAERLVDISWYNPTGMNFEIKNMQQFYGFAYLSRSYDFSGQTIKLGADITVNEGNAKDWQEEAPKYKWTPIAWHGTSLSKRFKGNFDGQGHTISGIYCVGDEDDGYIGLFGEIYHGSVVKDFKIVNSYFEGTMDSSVRGTVGSVCGRLRGTIDSVYSNAIIVNSARMTGGMAGMINGTGQNTISNCWFGGKITGVSRTGGILGGVYGNKANIEATIEHCLNTGEIAVEIGKGDVGGICGMAETWCTLYITDCLNTGTFKTIGDDKEANTHIGTIFGSVTETSGVGSKVIINNSFGTKEFYSKLVGWKYDDAGISQSSVAFVSADEVKGYGGYQWTTLDFENSWAVRTDDVPIPVVFASSRPSVSGVARMVDYSWYDADKDVLTIMNYQQLYAAARLWDVTNQFKGKTIKLGADIVVNEGNAADWAKEAPAIVWEPMRFNGTFDGGGHSISGIYVKGGEEDNYVGLFYRIYKDGVVKNLKLVNSYIEGTMPSNERGAVGSIAGRSNGVIDTVYSDAIVVNSARMTGGIVGIMTGEGTNLISNAWFDGSVTGVSRTGGIIGGLYGNKTDIQVNLEHCLNTGDIAVQIGYGDVGGLCGMVETGGILNLTDSLNAGTFATVGEGKEPNTHIGNIVGSVTKTDEVSSKVTMKHAYGVEEFYSKLIGWSYADDAVEKSSVAMTNMSKIQGEGGYQWTTLDFDKYWAVRAEDVPVLLAFAGEASGVAGVNRLIDISWYDENKDEYVITTKEQLYGFNLLCDSVQDYFKGKTVKLGADIALNDVAGEDKDAQMATVLAWGENEPENAWTPINFKGTFDGQGHTISGVYVKSDGTYTGFFTTVQGGAVVQNLNLENSYIEGTKTSGRCGTGSIAGRNSGTIDSVYSNAIVKNGALMTGGIAGMTTTNNENLITNCWFDGQIYANGNTGGILGGTYKSTATIDSCLNTGVLNIDADAEAGATAVGGLFGYAQSTSDVTLTDSLNVGSFVQVNSKEDSEAKVKQVGSLVGANHGDATISVSDSFGNHEFANKKFGYPGGDIEISDSANVYVTDLNGYGAYQWTTLDFEDENTDGVYWVLREGKLPVLNIYEQGDLEVADAKTKESYTWYDAELSELFIADTNQFNAFVNLHANKDRDYFADKTVLLAEAITELNISTPEEFLAINILCNSGNEYLAGRTIKLGQTIDLNPDWMASSTLKENGNVWTPVLFAGTFDGQGNAIRGLYVNNDSKDGGVGLFAKVEDGAIVKNLRLENGYVKAIKIVGSVAGRLAGTLQNVYSNVIVESAGNATGGLVGMMDTSGADNKIANCWYDGEIILTAKARGVGGLLGQVNHNSETIEAWIEGSLNTGKVTVEENVTAENVGGLCGFVHKNVDLSIVDSLNAGTISGNGTVSEEKGSVAGYVNTEADSMLTLTNVYGTAEFADKVCGSGIVTISDNSVAMLVNEDDIKGYGAYQWMRFDFENDWSLRSEKVPMPKAFGDGDLSASDASNLPSFTWYDENATELEIETVHELLGFSILGQTRDFAGQTITLAKDTQTVKTYNLNPNWTAGSTTKPTNVWTPVKNFKGTFDGQGNTIRGLYVSQPSSQDAGMFARVYGTVKNFRLENSYVKGSKMAGSIAGHIDGTIDSIYSNAIVSAEGNAVGGIAGMCETNKGDIYITNCWFEGTINSSGNYVGGILGYAYRASESLTVNISNCLNEGTIEIAGTKESKGIGGICGAATKIAGVELKINNSLNAGTFINSKTGKGSVTSLGTLVGLVTKANVTLTNAYGTTEFAAAVCGSSTGTVTGGECYDKLLLTGANAYHQTNLNFAEEGGTWSLREDEVPAPRVFVSENEIAIPSQKADLLIHNVDSLLEFAANSSEDTYEDELILLVDDIDLNPNWTASTNCEEPTNIWTPIASFKGTFDGQGHTIRGLYVSQTSTSNIGMFKAVYGTVKNFRLENSYIKGQKMVGSIAGQIEGTIDSVYSSAIVAAVENAIGGIAGMNQNPGATITNCWFAGEVSTSKNYVGGIVGYIYNKGNVEISHCLNTGNVTGGQQVGGICGYVQGKGSNTAKLDIIDSLSDATCSGTKQVGVIVGAIGNKGKLTVGNVYGTQTSASQKLYGYSSNNVTVSTGTEVKLVAANEIKGLETKASGLTFYLNNTFVEEDPRTCWWIRREDKIPMLESFNAAIISGEIVEEESN